MSDSTDFGRYLVNTVQEVTVPTLPGDWAKFIGSKILVINTEGASAICYQKTAPTSFGVNKLVPRFDFNLDIATGEISNVTTQRQQLHIPLNSPIFDAARASYNALLAARTYNHGGTLTAEQVAENYATVQALASAVGVSINIVIPG